MSSAKGFLEGIFILLSKILLNKFIKPFVVVVFVAIWGFSIYVIPSTNIGLDQTAALSSDSYVLTYYQDAFSYLKIGPPVYFIVMPGFRYENIDQRNLLCSQPSCSRNSMTTLINKFSKNSKKTKIATGAYSWIDSYSSWLKSTDGNSCCMYKNFSFDNKSFCATSSSYTRQQTCSVCVSEDENIDSEKFSEYLPWFLGDIPVRACPSAGKPLFEKAVILNQEYYKNKILTEFPIYTSSFMAYHTPMRNADDLITSLVESVKISNNISETINHTVIPYSPFYIFYESYFTIWYFYN